MLWSSSFPLQSRAWVLVRLSPRTSRRCNPALSLTCHYFGPIAVKGQVITANTEQVRPGVGGGGGGGGGSGYASPEYLPRACALRGLWILFPVIDHALLLACRLIGFLVSASKSAAAQNQSRFSDSKSNGDSDSFLAASSMLHRPIPYFLAHSLKKY